MFTTSPLHSTIGIDFIQPVVENTEQLGGLLEWVKGTKSNTNISVTLRGRGVRSAQRKLQALGATVTVAR